MVYSRPISDPLQERLVVLHHRTCQLAHSIPSDDGRAQRDAQKHCYADCHGGIQGVTVVEELPIICINKMVRGAYKTIKKWN